MQHSIAKFLAGLTRIESVVAIVAYALVSVLLLADVFGRELFGAGIYGAQKVAVLATLVAAFIGLSLASSEGGHMRAQALDRLVPRRWSAQADRLGHLLSALLFAALAVVSFRFVLDTRQFSIRVPVLGWALWPVQLVLPLAFGSSALKNLAFALYPALAPQRKLESV